MGENTTKTKPSHRLARHWRLLPAVVAACLLLAACSTARQRGTPENLLGNLRFRNDETFEFFHRVYRSGNLYRDFRPVMVVDAIFEDLRYRELFLQTLEEQFLIRPEELERMAARQQEQYGNRMDFLLFVYGGSNDKVNLHKADSPWKVFLRDDEGELISPAKMEKIGRKNTVFAFLKQYFVGLDRWSEVVRVSFPKLDKALLGQEPGQGPFQLILTGIPGTITLGWDNVALFYARPEESKVKTPQEAANQAKPKE